MQTVEDACGSDADLLCRSVFDWTGSETAAEIAVWVLDKPFRISVILLVAWLISRYVTRLVGRLVRGLTTDPEKQLNEMEDGPLKRSIVRLTNLRERRARAEQRAATLEVVLQSLVATIVWIVAVMLILSELGINLAPLVASAGVAGIAIGFGAQSVVRDFLAGIFVLVEDHYGVGDYVDVGDAAGTVEQVSLRTTRLRDASGVLWIVPNGEVRRVGNYSQLYSQTRMQFEVSYDTDIEEAMRVIEEVLDEVWHENREDATVIEEPVVLGIDAFKDSAIVISAVIKTDPSEQWAVAREIRLRMKKAFEQHGIEIPFPQRTIWLKNEAAAAVES